MESAIKELILWRIDKARNALREAEANLNMGFYGVCMTRSYYAVLYSMQAANGLCQFDSSKHSGVIAFFRKTFLKTGLMDKELSKIIQETSNHRERADYEDFYTASKEDAEKQLRGAGQFVAAVSDWLRQNMK